MRGVFKVVTLYFKVLHYSKQFFIIYRPHNGSGFFHWVGSGRVNWVGSGPTFQDPTQFRPDPMKTRPDLVKIGLTQFIVDAELRVKSFI